MDTIQYLFSALIRLAIALFVVAIVWWLISIFFPMLGARNLLSLTNSNTAGGDWLPAPKNGLFGKVKAPDGTDNVYKPGDAYNGYGNAYNNNAGGAQVDYVTYTSSGTQIIHGNGGVDTVGSNGVEGLTVTYVRNLSIYQGGHVYNGLTFMGDAREIMFKNGKFPIITVDQENRVVNTSYAEATDERTLPGWVRFYAKINGVLPNRIPCMMVFEQAMVQSAYYIGDVKKDPIRFPFPVLCN